MIKIKKALTKGIASGVGMASEAMAERKESKTGETSVSATTLSNTSTREDEKDDSSSEDEVELAWELDEASAQLQPPPYDEAIAEDPSAVAQTFLRTHTALSQPLQPYKPLSAPVILPQRRPNNKTRGFVRAYPPTLQDCAGIDQQAFLDFLQAFDKASKASPVYNVINIACMVGGIAGGPIGQGVTIAIQVAAGVAKEVQTRYKRNTFLDTINETWLMPKGLYAMIMTYKPDAPAVIGMNVTSTDQALAKVTSEPTSAWQKNFSKMRLTSGVTKGEASLPEGALLIYPAIDQAADSTSQEKQNFIKESGDFMSTYLDRRAHAVYAETNSSSKLVTPESQRRFKSQYGDPNHPIHSGSIMGLLTAGKFDPVRAKRARKAQRRAGKQGITLTPEEIQAAEMGRDLGPERGGRRKPRGVVGLVLTPVRKAMRPDLLYLTIVNLPSESEMMEIRQELERVQSK